MKRRTKIVATLGPATDAEGELERLLAAGVDVVRINFSHGDPDSQQARVSRVREISRDLGIEVAVMADLRGPKIRVEHFADDYVDLEAGQAFVMRTGDDPAPGDASGVGVTYRGLAGDVKPGSELLLDDGLIAMAVERVDGGDIHCRVTTPGRLYGRKGLNLRGGGLTVPGVSPEDEADIRRAAEWDVDYLAVSFPRNADDIHRARKLLQAAGGSAGLVAKIERAEALGVLDEIVDASDAVLVARGDLGVEIGEAELPAIQKRIIRTSLDRNRAVITATQMMQSMVENPIPTRAEVLDVANAVIDGTDAVMLSAETAVGRHPVKVIEAMERICQGAERHVDQAVDERRLNVHFERIDQTIAMAAMFTAAHVSLKAIIALTESGSTAQWLSRARSRVPIYALSPNRKSLRRMRLFRDVYPLQFDHSSEDRDHLDQAAVRRVAEYGAVAEGDRVLVTLGDTAGLMGGTNTLKFLQVGPGGEASRQPELQYR